MKKIQEKQGGADYRRATLFAANPQNSLATL
jgi:hypothetical protein